MSTEQKPMRPSLSKSITRHANTVIGDRLHRIFRSLWKKRPYEVIGGQSRPSQVPKNKNALFFDFESFALYIRVIDKRRAIPIEDARLKSLGFEKVVDNLSKMKTFYSSRD